MHFDPGSRRPHGAEGPASTWGRLRLGERIGEGAFGQVFRAFDLIDEREVALKLMRPRPPGDRPGARARREYINLAKVHHPNVVEAYGVATNGRRSGLWMELVYGATLGQLLRTRGRFSAEEAAFVGQELCRALAAVHAAGLVHADVKVHNVMQAHCGRTVLMDFGASLPRMATWSQYRRLTGTLVCLAPEVLRGGKPSVAADVYSLGVLLFQLVTGSYPVDGSSFGELARAHACGYARRLEHLNPDLPDAFIEAVDGALADVGRRHRSADEMGALLSRVVPSIPSVSGTAVAPMSMSLPLELGNATTRSAVWMSRADIGAVPLR